MTHIPETTGACAGCGKDLNLLAPYLSVVVKAERKVLVSEEAMQTGGGDLNVPEGNVYLGSKSGRGRMMVMHDFDCLNQYSRARKGQEARLEVHAEEGEPYVPDDNRTPEELVEAGELPKEALAYAKAAADFSLATIEREDG